MPPRFLQLGAAAGVETALREMAAERIALQMQEEARQRQREADARAERQLRLSEENARFNREAQQEQREQFAAQRRQSMAHTLAGDLAPGDVLDPEQTSTLRAGNLGSNIDHQSATIGSRAMGGYGTMPSTKVPSGGGMLRTVSQPAQAERNVYRGTPTQRRVHEQQQGLRQWMESLPPDSPERRTIEYQLRTGNNPPAGFFNRESPDRYSPHPMFDESGEQIGVGAFNSATGEFKPVNAGGFLRAPGARGGASSRQLPTRVESFLLQLRSKHPRYEDALSELTSILANAPGETFSRVAASNALRQLYARPSGNDDALNGINVGSILNPDAGRQPAAPRQAPSQPASGGMVTRAELRAVAQQLGISERDAEQQAIARGMQVR